MYEWKNVIIHEAEACQDHVRMLISIPPKISVSGFLGYLKGKSSVLIYQRYLNIKFINRNRKFWCRRYYVDAIGKNKNAIVEYIANQLKEDKEIEQMIIQEITDPFKK